MLQTVKRFLADRPVTATSTQKADNEKVDMNQMIAEQLNVFFQKGKVEKIPSKESGKPQGRSNGWFDHS